MSDKSGVSAQATTLPNCGGALQGIGDTFAPDLFSGTGNFTVPLQLPSGRHHFQHELSLHYSTGNGNGPFGLGWALSVPDITRKTATGIRQYFDLATDPTARDTLSLLGHRGSRPNLGAGARPMKNARFCHGCGSSVAASDTHAEYKQVTVLFADVVHSIATTEGSRRAMAVTGNDLHPGSATGVFVLAPDRD